MSEITEEQIGLAVEMIRKGLDERKIRAKLGENWEEIVEIARARIRAKDKFSRDDLWMDLEGLRYATHEVVAKYRAERLAEFGVKSIADVSCGIGIQLIFYAMKVEKAYGVDIDPKKIEFARKNAEKYGVRNIEFINADSLAPETIERIDAEVIFSDPARPPEMPERRLEDLLPSPLAIYESYKHKTDSFIFDLPPQIRREKVPWKGEFEYIDLFGHLNRLTFYTEPLAKAERSAVVLPKGVRLESNPNLEDIVTWTEEPKQYLYEIPQAVDYADLLNELFHSVNGELKMLLREKRRVLATSDERVESDYFKRSYTVVGVTKFHPLRINDFLRREGFGRATLRISIPENEYWRFRKRIEANLKGDRRAFIFQFKDRAIIAEAL
ncbi:methyltransferase domain-containing protein [Thermococcus sp. GR7]|uniref:class I SAM-dependent methyltransferase n=1 Tax=unclassified Thermococcus TaxID=2627626 RepID=UPI0014318102|nr:MULTISPECIES: methyltransferase domain-containing protein [unclassified Thermococcus]NJE47214.1 methyltransferase domain-containing protein [Thermococcus sp. GR7]NJE79007.1 methyltransferase domain-containing protein [Thermococcus sp. GR4]NJF22617.1 methyltransferase domain-containing protein [Thermococcus sp. GR5]